VNEPLLPLISRADDHPALVAPERDSVSFAELHEVVERLAGQLVAAGVEPGDAVALSLPNGPEIILAFLAIVRAGAAAAPLNPGYTAPEFQAYLEDLRPRVMLFRGSTAEVARGVCAALDIAALDLPPDGPARDLSLPFPALAVPDVGPDSVALLLHTSGTTSKPKIVPLRQQNLAHSTRTISAHYGLSADDVSLCVMPLFHVHGLLASTLASLHSGGTIVTRPRFSPRTFWEDAIAHRGTWYSAVPTIHQMLLSHAQIDMAPVHLRFARSCSSALPPALQEALEDRLGIPVVQAYGMTEASHQMSSNPLPPGQRRTGSVGPATGVEAAVLDESWRPVAVGNVGEVSVRGASVIDGYRDNPAANEASFRDGWFRTGDSGTISADGYLTLSGRIKELINRGGEKISPHEVEDALTTHPSVAEAVAYAVPDERYGEQVAAAVVLRRPATTAELTKHCAERLAAFKVPVSITVLDAIPKGPTGKVQRRLLAEQINR
jgi:acyl-CoA synthetase (AMP-forming)/AMP-acid ligase II